jgi:hypothetical protein
MQLSFGEPQHDRPSLAWDLIRATCHWRAVEFNAPICEVKLFGSPVMSCLRQSHRLACSDKEVQARSPIS